MQKFLSEMTHRCWAVDEIVRAIVSNLVRDEKKASAVALATCSKSLEEPALGEVWRRLSGLAPLVKCFPSDVWEVRGKERKLFFKRAPLEAEWIRFQNRYATKVRHLRAPYRYSLFCLSSTAAHLLQLYASDGPLLPNLLSLDWSSDEIYFPFVALFISPSLTSIYMYVPGKASSMLPPIFRRLSKLSPDILEIEVDLDDDNDQSTSLKEASSQLLLHCSHRLRKCRVGSLISASALSRVTQLPSLEEFLLVGSSLSPLDPLHLSVFPSLRELAVQWTGNPTWLRLLPAIDNPVLTGITVKCPGSDFQRFMDQFQETMTRCEMHKSLQEFTVDGLGDFEITPHLVACNFSFNNLTSLIITPECTSLCQTANLTDNDIDLLTKAMPCLETLNLGSNPCSSPSQITFKSLYTVSRRCTKLEDLQIHFNPALFVTKAREFEFWDVALGLPDFDTPSADLCPIATIFVGSIPLPAQSHASSILALGLLRVFPSLQDIVSDTEEWCEVEKLIGIFRRISFGRS